MGNENSKTLQEIQISENLEKDHFDIIDDIASIKSLMSDATISGRVRMRILFHLMITSENLIKTNELILALGFI